MLGLYLFGILEASCLHPRPLLVGMVWYGMVRVTFSLINHCSSRPVPGQLNAHFDRASFDRCPSLSSKYSLLAPSLSVGLLLIRGCRIIMCR